MSEERWNVLETWIKGYLLWGRKITPDIILNDMEQLKKAYPVEMAK